MIVNIDSKIAKFAGASESLNIRLPVAKRPCPEV